MKRWIAVLPLLFLVGFSAGWRRSYRGKNGEGFLFNFTGGFPPDINAIRTSSDVFYTRNGAHAIERSDTAYACEDIGNGLGRGCWAALSSYINDTTGAGNTLTQFATGDGWVNSGGTNAGVWDGNVGMERVASCATGPDGLTPATCLYDFAATYTAAWQKLGADSTLKEVLASIWVKTTGVAQPAFSGNFNFNYDLGRFQQFGGLPFDLTWASDITTDVDGYLTCASFVKLTGDPSTTHHFTLWDVNTTLPIMTLDTTGETANGWQINQVSPGVHLTAGHHYRWSIDYHLGGDYVENVDFVPFPRTQGHITVNGVFYTKTLGDYPNIDNSAGNTWFSNDICFEPDTNNNTHSDPTQSGAFLAINSNTHPGAFPDPPPSQWTRLTAGFASDGITPVFGAMLLYPSGAHVSGLSIDTFEPTSLGGLAFWGPQVAVGVIGGDPPMVLGTSGDLKMTVTDSARLGTIPTPAGKFNIVADYLIDGNDTSFAQPAKSNVLFDFDTPDGKYNIFDGDQTVLSATVRGVDPTTSGLTINIGLLQADTIFRTQLYYDPAIPESTIAGWVNGCAASIATVGSVSGAVSSPTLAAIGSQTDGTFQTQRRVASWASGNLIGRDDPYKNEFLIQGDSLVSEYPGDHPAVCKYIYTVAESIERPGIFSYAFPGETIEQQYTRYTLSKQFGQSYVVNITEQAGINNISLGQTDVQTLGHYQTAVTGFNTNNPDATVYLMPLWPTNATLTGTQQGYYLTVNQAIIGQGGTPITGTHLVRMYPGTALWQSGIYWPFINDGANNLASWTSIDGRHQNTAGSIYMGAVTAGYFEANLQLPGGVAPTCTGFSPASGAVGSTITLTGTGFTSILGAGVNGHGIGSGIPLSDTSATIVVPPGATTGPITVANPVGTVTCSGGSFTVL